ncbi:MAG: thiamine phosphate synthase [Gammaproteobacteria bacterium]|nr:thiamine phosphate synthase [Gammaproteobacteria bacterium]
MHPLPTQGLYAITDCENLTTIKLVEKTEQILKAGAVMLQYRNKKDGISVRRLQVFELGKLCEKYNIPLIINDDLELVLLGHADGIHVGRDDATYDEVRRLIGPDRIIGISCYNEFERAIEAEHMGANYIAFGSFFPSTTKPGAMPAELNLVKAAKKKLNLPIVAIGGITPENGRSLIDAGADFLAVISGLYSPADSFSATQAYIELFNN